MGLVLRNARDGGRAVVIGMRFPSRGGMSCRIYHGEDIVFISLGDNVSFSAFIIPSKAL